MTDPYYHLMLRPPKLTMTKLLLLERLDAATDPWGIHVSGTVLTSCYALEHMGLAYNSTGGDDYRITPDGRKVLKLFREYAAMCVERGRV